jgi:aconitate hydratase
VLAKLGDSVTTDHISPAGSIKADSPGRSVPLSSTASTADFNSYGSRRGNHEVMIRGTFANIRLRNQLLDDVEGGFTRDFTGRRRRSRRRSTTRRRPTRPGIPLVILAGKEYGSGSSRDWAAKGTALLGVKAVIAESYERIHRSNLIGMGVLPLQYPEGQTPSPRPDRHGDLRDHRRHGNSTTARRPKHRAGAEVTRSPARTAPHRRSSTRWCASTPPARPDYYRNGGILQYVLRSLVS